MGKSYARRSVADTAGVAELYVVPLFWQGPARQEQEVSLALFLAFRGGRRLSRVASINMNTNTNGG